MKFEVTEFKYNWECTPSPNKINQNTIAKLHLALLTLIVLIPLFYVVYISFQTLEEYYKMAWPNALHLENYKNVISAPYFWKWVLNSGVIACITLAFVLIIGAMAGYVIAKFSSRFVRFLGLIILGALMIPIHMVLIPVFILCRQLGIINTHWAVIGPSVTFGISIAMYIFRGFFMNIPDSLAEAARIDGASEVGVFMRVMLPMTKPAMATVGVFTFLGSWNGFLFPLVLLQQTENYTLPVGLATIGTQYSTNYPAQAAAMILVSLPMVMLYIKFNKLIIQGMVEGAVKG